MKVVFVLNSVMRHAEYKQTNTKIKRLAGKCINTVLVIWICIYTQVIYGWRWWTVVGESDMSMHDTIQWYLNLPNPTCRGAALSILNCLLYPDMFQSLTSKGVAFQWTDFCQEMMDLLKAKLTTAQVLAKPFVLLYAVPVIDSQLYGQPVTVYIQ